MQLVDALRMLLELDVPLESLSVKFATKGGTSEAPLRSYPFLFYLYIIIW